MPAFSRNVTSHQRFSSVRNQSSDCSSGNARDDFACCFVSPVRKKGSQSEPSEKSLSISGKCECVDFRARLSAWTNFLLMICCKSWQDNGWRNLQTFDTCFIQTEKELVSNYWRFPRLWLLASIHRSRSPLLGPNQQTERSRFLLPLVIFLFAFLNLPIDSIQDATKFVGETFFLPMRLLSVDNAMRLEDFMLTLDRWNPTLSTFRIKVIIRLVGSISTTAARICSVRHRSDSYSTGGKTHPDSYRRTRIISNLSSKSN